RGPRARRRPGEGLDRRFLRGGARHGLSRRRKRGTRVSPTAAAAMKAPRFTREALAQRVDSFRGRRVVVIGDVILDRYLWGRATRVSPEAPVLVVDVDKEELRLGGAANVAQNVRALGAQTVLIGALGDDGAAADLERLLETNGVEPDSGIVRDRARRTTMKTRILAHHQQVLRADEE